jgi:CRP-like cAMP-binding protein
MPITKQEIAGMLDSTGWANDFAWQQMLLLSDYLQVNQVQADELIFTDGDVGDSMGIIIKGTARVYKGNKTLTELKAGRTFGEMLLFDNERRSASIVAVEPCTFLSMDKTNFDRLSKDHPALALKLTIKIARLLNQNIRRLSGQLCDI